MQPAAPQVRQFQAVIGRDGALNRSAFRWPRTCGGCGREYDAQKSSEDDEPTRHTMPETLRPIGRYAAVMSKSHDQVVIGCVAIRTRI